MLRSKRLFFPIFLFILFVITILTGSWGASAAVLFLQGEPVTASFYFIQDRNSAPAKVNFISTSHAEDPIESWYWDFNDGKTSIGKSSINIFTEPNEYEVSLTVTAGGSSDTVTETVYVGENDLYIFRVPDEGPAPLTVEFDAVEEDGLPTSVLWDFGDGETSKSYAPNHVYEEPGWYDVSLTGWYYSSPKFYHKYECNDCVYVYENPVASFIARPTAGLPPLTVTFTETTSLPWLVDYYEWFFGDGSSVQNEPYPSHVYTTTGEYQVELWVYPFDGDPSVVTRTITVKELSADFEADHQAGTAPLTIQFTDLSIYMGGPVESWIWDFGDGTGSEEQNPVHTFTDTGMYTISLLIGAGTLNDTVVKTDYIRVEISRDFDVRDYFCDKTLSSFWGWSTLSDPSYSLSDRIGYFRLMIPDDTTYEHGYSDDAPFFNYTLIDNVTLAKENWMIETRMDLTEYTEGSDFQAGLALYFNTSDMFYWGPYQGTNLRVEWSEHGQLGEEITNSSALIYLRIRKAQNNYYFEYRTDEENPWTTGVTYIRNNVPLTPEWVGFIARTWEETNVTADFDYFGFNGGLDISFETYPTSGPAPFEAAFIQYPKSPLIAYQGWSWDFGDGESSDESDPVHLYTSPGLYTVSLTTIGQEDSYIFTRPSYIEVTGLTAGFDASPTEGKLPLIVNFQDHSASNLPIDSWFWDFGDGITGTAQNPSHIYTSPGVYTVSLQVWAGSETDIVTRPSLIEARRYDNATILTDTLWYSETVLLNNLIVASPATLYLSGTTVISAENVLVEEGAAISADGMGYGSGSGPGAGEAARYFESAGGGAHGGFGGNTYNAAGGTPYDSLFSPFQMGSGGGNSETSGKGGGTGGGAVHLIVAHTLALNGTISVNGGNGQKGSLTAYGGGAGGSIWIEAGRIEGNGIIKANGGEASSYTYYGQYYGGGGAGGRIALDAGNRFEGSILTCGGYGAEFGGPGTIYLAAENALLVNNCQHDGEQAGLIEGEYTLDRVTLEGSGHLSFLGSESIFLLGNDSLSGDGSARLGGEGNLIVPTSTFVISGVIVALDAGYWTPPASLEIDNGGLELYAANPWFNNHYELNDVNIRQDGVLDLIPSVTHDNDYSDDRGLTLNLDSLSLESGAIVMAGYSVTVQAGQLSIAEGAILSADGTGYARGKGQGAGVEGSGGGHGGQGGNSDDNEQGGQPYDSVYLPALPGSSGGYGTIHLGTNTPGSGGGAVYLVVTGSLLLDGQISADGGDAFSDDNGGGGSGGSILIETAVLTTSGSASGVIRANGGASGNGGGGGGGGRIAIYADTDHYNGVIQVQGGDGYHDGQPGSIFLNEFDPDLSAFTTTPAGGITANGLDGGELQVTLLSSEGEPVAGSDNVYIEVIDGDQTFINGAATAEGGKRNIGNTNSQGIVTATLTSTAAGVKTLSAWIGDVELPQPTTVTFVAGPPDPASSEIWADPVEIAADGVAASTIYVRVLDAYDNLVPGVAVTLTDTSASTTLIQPIGLTGTDGETWGALSGVLAEVVTVTAMAGGVSLADSAVVNLIQADLEVFKQGPASVLAGSPVVYQISVQNVGMMPAEGVVLTDTLPSGMAVVTHTAPFPMTQIDRELVWQIGEMAAGASTGFELTARPAMTLPHGIRLTNQVIATTTSLEGMVENNLAQARTTVYQPMPDMNLSPVYTELAVERGTTTTLMIDLQNSGSAAISSVVAMLPPALPWVQIDPMAIDSIKAGGSATLTVTIAPPAGQPVGMYRDAISFSTVNAGAAEAAFTIRVYESLRDLQVIVFGGSGTVAGASVQLSAEDTVVLMTEGIEAVMRAEEETTTGTGGESLFTSLDPGVYEYTVYAQGHGSATGVVTVTEGIELQSLEVTLDALPRLVAEPARPQIYVKPGETNFAQVSLRNVGLGTAENLIITTPSDLPWIYVGTSDAVDALTAGGTLLLTIYASPPAGLAPAVYKNYVTVQAENASPIHLAITVNVDDREEGTWQLLVTDPAGQPVEGVQVTLVGMQGTDVVGGGSSYTTYDHFTRKTGAGGTVVFENVPEGDYVYYLQAEGYKPFSAESVVGGGETVEVNESLDALPFTVTWTVQETEIPDVYSATIDLIYDPSRLHVLPLDIVVPTGGGVVADTIQVRNLSDFDVTSVHVAFDIKGLDFEIQGQGMTIYAGETGEFPFTVLVPADNWANGFVKATANEMLPGEAPVQIHTESDGGGGWRWHWNGNNRATGEYSGPYPTHHALGSAKESTGFSLEPWFETIHLRINQNIIMERQAFLAEIAIQNTAQEIQDLQVDIIIENLDGEPVPYLFTITPTLPTKLGNLAPGAETGEQWLIVPYYQRITDPVIYVLRATANYTVNGEIRTFTTRPELIQVRPQPEVHVSYFVPRFVRGGSAFLLGVVAENRGAGEATDLRIESSQPEILSMLEVPMSFTITGTLIMTNVSPGELTLNLGNLPPGGIVSGGWFIVPSHHGEIVKLKVSCQHQDYAGTQLSNLLYCKGENNQADNSFWDIFTNECPSASFVDKQGIAGSSINTESGNYHYGIIDLHLQTEGDPLYLGRSYNSKMVQRDTDTFSAGWTHNYAMRLEFPDFGEQAFFKTWTELSNCSSGDCGDPSIAALISDLSLYYRPFVQVRLSGGSRLWFADQGNGEYSVYPGGQASLTRTEDGGQLMYSMEASDSTQYIFDQDGVLQRIVDRHDNETVLVYDEAGRLEKVTGPGGDRWLTFVYDQEGRIERVLDSAGQSVIYGYDSMDNMTTVIGTDGLAWQYTYITGTHLLHEVYDPSERLVERTNYNQVTVDGETEWRATGQETGAGVDLSLSYQPYQTTIVEAGNQRIHKYDQFGVLSGEVDPAGNTQTYISNQDFQRVSSTDALGRTTLLAWSACCGQLESLTDALGNQTFMEYDDANNLVSYTDPAGHTTDYVYDDHNNLTAQVDALGNRVRYGYNEQGQIVSSTNPAGVTTLFDYDELGQLIEVIDPAGLATRSGYDAAGRPVIVTSSIGTATVNEYDLGGRVVRVTENYTSTGGQNYLDLYNIVTSYEYDGSGRLTGTTDTLGRKSVSEYDDGGRLVRQVENYLPGYPQNYQNVYNLVTEYGYDAAGYQDRITDTLGVVSLDEYDETGRLARSWQNYEPGYPQNYQNIYNRLTEYGYDAVGNRILVADTLGNVTFTEYDALNRVIRTWQNYRPDLPRNYQETYNRVTEYEYDLAGNQNRTTDTLGRVTLTEFDALNRPVTTTVNYVDGVFDSDRPDEDLVQVTVYDQAGRPVEYWDYTAGPAGDPWVTRQVYDDAGRLVKVIDDYQDGVFDPAEPDRDVAWLTVYDDRGLVSGQVEIATERITTTYTYDPVGRQIGVTDALSGTTETHYDVLGRETAAIDAEGNHTWVTYDPAGRVVAVTDSLSAAWTTGYDPLGRRTAETDPLGHTTVYTYDQAGRLTATADPLGNVNNYAYDALGRNTVITDADGVAVYTVYDAAGRAIETRDSLGNATGFGYDALGNQVVMTNPLGIATRYEYDLLGRLAAVVENWQPGIPPDHQTNVRTAYEYDAAGNLVALHDGLEHTTTYEFDRAGRQTAAVDPLGNVTLYTYDGHGRRVAEIYPDAAGPITVTTGYNLLGLPTRIDYPATGQADGFTVEFAYNALGYRTVMTDASGTTSMMLDALYQPLAVDAPGGEVQYRYDQAGRRTHIVYPTGQVATTTLDAAGRLETVTDWEGGVTYYTFTPAGRLSQVRLPNGIVSQYRYDGAGRLIEIEHRSGETLLAHYIYTLDAAGNRVQVEETLRNPEELHGPGEVIVTVRDTGNNPEAGLNVYIFDGTTYTGRSGITNESGQWTVTLPEGEYRFRADKNGTQFWSDGENHCEVPRCREARVTTTIPVNVIISDTNGNPESGLPVYAFNDTAYTGYFRVTGANGQAFFTLPQGDYRFRTDKNGTQFWSGEANHCPLPGCTATAVTTTIPISVTVADTNGLPESGLPVFAFDGASYTGYNRTTDTLGQALFTLPQGDYRFRTDKNGTQFWSGEANHCTLPGCTATAVTTTVPVSVTVADTDGNPGGGLQVYAFDGAAYTGYQRTTNANGVALFTLPMGDYRFRADKNGTQFWSGETNHCALPGCSEAEVVTSIPVVVSVTDSGGDPEAGIPVYVFDGASYTGFQGSTDPTGRVTMTLPVGDYRFRADKNGTQFWSSGVNHCTVPGCTSAMVSLTTPAAVVTVADTDGAAQAGLPVYAFTGSSYTGYQGTTNVSGQVNFTLPEGEYRFRTDKNGVQFWSGAVNHCAVPGCAGATITTTIPIAVTVKDTDSDPESGLAVYAFNGTSYTGYQKTTDFSGQATFTLPMGDYRFRADKNGVQFWSGGANHCTLPGCTAAAVTTTVPVYVSVADTDANPEAGLAVYAFNGSSYTGYQKTTNSAGQAIFTLPMGDYRFRADKNGTQFWSSIANHCTLPGCTTAAVTTTVPVTATVKDAGGNPEGGLAVYAFDGTSYTGYQKTTNATGQAIFTLPMGEYRFRADKDGEQYWSGETNHCTLPGCTTATVVVDEELAYAEPPTKTASAPPIGDVTVMLMAPLLLLSAGWRKRRGSLWLRTTGGILLAAAIVFGIACLAPAPAMATASTPATPTIYLLPPSAPASLPTESAPEAPAAQFTTGISTTRVINYTYDPLGRLTSAAYSSGELFGYAYDAVGNISWMTETITSTVVTTFMYDPANRLTHVDGNSLTWDERGNLLEDQYGTVYAYDAANRLIHADKDGVTYEFGYNGLGDRLSQTVNGLVTTYTLDIVSGLTQVLYDGTNSYLYPSTAPRASGLGRIGEKQPDGWVYHVTDGLGSVRQLANSDAYIVLAQSFEPFGGLMEREGDASSVYGFTGEPVDGTGLVYLRARYYAPSFSRFLSADTIAPDLWNPQSINRYSYVSNNPILYIDPTGHFVDTAFDLVQVGFDLNDICQNGLNFWSGAALAVDVVFVIVPFATGGGAVVRAANRADEVFDIVIHNDDVIDVAKVSDSATEVLWGKNYRKNYEDYYQIQRNTDFDIHHNFPRKYREILEKVGINVDDPAILREVLRYDPITNVHIHQKLYTDVWEYWEFNLGHSPEPEEIIKFAQQLEEQYYIEGTLFYREGANLPGLVDWDTMWQIYKGNK